MVLAIFITMVVCVLIWWIASDRTYYRLGQYLSFGGIIVAVIGILVGATGVPAWGTEPMDFRYEKLRMISDTYRKLRGEDRTNTSLMVFLCGVGLVCFILGLLINPGLY